MSAGWIAAAGATNPKLAEEYARLKKEARRAGCSIRHERVGDWRKAGRGGVMLGRVVMVRAGAVVEEAGYQRFGGWVRGQGWCRWADGDEEVGWALWFLKRVLENM